MKINISRYLPVVVWMSFMFYLSSRSDLPSGATLESDFIGKKFAHIFEYFILNYLWYRALLYKNPGQAMLFSLIYAFTDEIHQLFIPGRTGKLRDVGIDFIGISASTLLILKFSSWKNLLFPTLLKRHKK